jgi:hypothetical protein
MRFDIQRAALLAAFLFLALFAYRMAFGPRQLTSQQGGHVAASQQSIDMARKNYATSRLSPAGQGFPDAGNQKYEKVATLTQHSSDYEADRKRIDSLIAAHQGIVQFELTTGLSGQRTLSLGIGVPPDSFDAFVEAAKAVGKSAQIEVTKNDRTNEYLKLRARRATLEKARSGIEALLAAGGSIDERIRAQDKLTGIEESLQALGVSLGEFDTQNELCTVKLALRETRAVEARSLAWRVTDALQWTSVRYAQAGGGFLGLMIGLWLAAMLARLVQRFGGPVISQA